MVALEIVAAKNILQEIATQAYGLAMGLQNIAPMQTSGLPKSVHYLLEISLEMTKQDGAEDAAEQYEKLIQHVRQLIEHDISLREKYAVGEKFRFVRERLQELLQQLVAHAEVAQVAQAAEQSQPATDKVLVYVHLYNAQGTLLRNWSSMFLPKVFYEYSVNRPIYAEKNQIEAFLRTKKNKQHHGYLTIAVSREEIIFPPKQAGEEAAQNPVVKVKEGSLHFNNLVSFTHNDIDYTVSATGELKRIDS